MVKKRLTITLESDLIEPARRYAERHSTSLSRLVTNYLAQLGTEEGESTYSPTVRRLRGILPGDTDVEPYRRYQEEKHRR
jgi:hypothetical protein